MHSRPWTPIITDFAAIPQRHRNYVRLVFTDPAIRALYADWDHDARLCVAQLHMEVARDRQDPQLAELVGELAVLDADFRRWWSDHQVAVRSRGTKSFHHPIVGDLTLDWDALTCAGNTDQQLVSWSAEPGTPSHKHLQALARHVQTGSSAPDAAPAPEHRR
jgi:hypothetical protein